MAHIANQYPHQPRRRSHQNGKPRPYGAFRAAACGCEPQKSDRARLRQCSGTIPESGWLS